MISQEFFAYFSSSRLNFPIFLRDNHQLFIFQTVTIRSPNAKIIPFYID